VPSTVETREIRRRIMHGRSVSVPLALAGDAEHRVC
jgi:hypothetical protein